MAGTLKKPSRNRERVRARSWPWLVPGLLVLALLVAGGIAGFIWYSSRSANPVADVAVIDPPVLELAGVDPAIARAIESAQSAVKETPRSVAAWGQLGKTLLVHDFYLPASTCLAQAEQLEPAKACWPYLQGISLASADPPDPQAALEKFQRAVELGGDTPDTLRLRLGEALFGQDRLDEAEQQFQRVLQLEPTNARAHLGLARIAIRRGDLEASKSHLESAVANVHTKKAARLLLLEVQQRLGKEPSADEQRDVAHLPEDTAWPDPYWDEATRLRTGMKAHLYRAERLLRQGRTPEALALLQQTVRDYPDSYYAWLILGKALIKQKNVKAAEQALNTALKLAPDSAETQFHLGVALYRQEKYRAAEALFRSATEAKPNFAAAHYNLGYCLQQRGDRAGAIEAFRTALRCQPDYADAHTSLSLILADMGKPAEALEHARLALHYNPADPTAQKLVPQLLKQQAAPGGPTR